MKDLKKIAESENSSSKTKTLNSLAKDLTRDAFNNKLDPVLARDKENYSYDRNFK